nr:inducible metalloproteinase inhibitor protein-like [Megalopta genalis]
MLKLSIVCFVAIAVLLSSTSATVLICNGPNEEYACGSACQRRCDSLNEPCMIVNIKCNDACYCKEGFARNCRDICIPIDSCSHKKCMWRNPYFGKLIG